MSRISELIKVWQGYPAAVSVALSPWLEPFQRIELINNRWRPEIDAVANVVVVAAVLWLMAKQSSAKKFYNPSFAFFVCVAGALVLGVLCFITKANLIHLVDPDWIAPANFGWGFAYVMMFVFLASAVFFLMVLVRSGP